MHRTAARSVLAALAVSTLLLASCGSSSGSDAADETTTTAAKATTTTEAEDTSTTEDEDTSTTEAEDTSTTAAGGDDAVCDSLQALKESDEEANTLVAGGDWAKIQAFYVDNTDDIIAIYDTLIAADTEVTAEFENLRSVTVSAGDLAASSSSLMDFSGKLTAQPNLAASGQAAVTANEFAQETCGFPLAGF